MHRLLKLPRSVCDCLGCVRDQTISPQVPVAKPAAEASSDSSDETSTEGEDHGSSSSSASEDEDEASMAQHVPKKVKKHATAASSSTIPTSPPKAKKSRTGA